MRLLLVLPLVALGLLRAAPALAAGFITFVASPEGQGLITAFGKDKHGESLYNDAAYAKKYE